ncbi:MAG: NADH-quinone oxidoreductase subunit L [Candidatus Omnitrophica bacterium]|nr:NADH-quinone oxidoreductase subunit L [Candidatus Omnitrophota bacterium]
MNFILPIIVPIIGSFFIIFLPNRYKAGGAIGLLSATFLSCLYLIPRLLNKGVVVIEKHLFEWFSMSFVFDGVSVFMALVSSFVSLIIVLYALEYMKHYEQKGEFYFWVVLFVGAMMGLVFSYHLLLIYCFWEITAVSSWRLIGFYRQEKDTKAADRAFLVTFFGASLMLAGIILIYNYFGTLSLGALKGKEISNVVSFLLLAGILSKSAQLPLQTWLPDAGVAPTPVTALLHAAVLVKIGVYAFIRIFYLTLSTPQLFQQVCLTISILTILLGAGSALRENNIKRILAYSTISQLGYMLLVISLKFSFSLEVGLLYIFAHSLAKGGLFLCAGIIEHKSGTKDIRELGGLLKSMPYTSLAYLLCAFSIIGLPPFLGFWPKFMTVFLLLKREYLFFGFLSILGAIFTLMYLMRLYHKVFAGEVKIEIKENRRSIMVFVSLFMGILSLLFGLFIFLPVRFITQFIS